MKNKILLACILIFMLSASLTSAQEIFEGNVIQEFEPKSRELMLQLEPWLKEAQAIQMGPYKIFRPKENNNPKLWVTSPSNFELIAIDENSISIMLKDNSHGGVLLSDGNEDGIFEQLSYEILDPQSGKSGTVFDWDRDGETDLKIIFSGEQNTPADVSVRLLGQWQKLIRKDKKSWVSINGEMKEIKKEGPKYIFVK